MFGRYLVIDKLGEGGMGEVFTAYDPELDRKVALKRVTVDGGSRRQGRLLLEAQAMAKIRHPNVVAVFDVGQIAHEVYIAMELVDGQTLRRWMEVEHDASAIAEVFVQAARGLAAAHDRGLVHRDFKPDNAIVDREGRLQVLDFGLAASVRDEATAGSMAGTPAYMAPEQYGLGLADARADQFALCVALFEALHGARPFQGDTLHSLALAVCEGALVEPASPRKIPRWLDRAMRRGLAIDPAQRWPSLREFVAVLETGLAHERRGHASWWIGGGLGIAVVSAAIALAPPGANCDDAGARVDAVWHEGVRAMIGAAFTGAATPLGAETWPAIEGKIDRRAEQLRAAYRETCEAGQSRAPEHIDQADRQRVCLHGHAQGLDGALEVLAIADSGVIENAAGIIDGLPLPGQCATRVARLEAELDPATRERARRAAALADGLLRAGKAADAKRAIDEATSDGVFTGDPAVVAEFAVLEARALVLTSAMAEAALALERGYLAARQSDDRAAMLAVARVHVAYHAQRREADAARRWIERARVEATALDDAFSLAVLEDDAALELSHLGRFEEAITTAQRALAQLDRLGKAESPEAVRAFSNLGGYYFSLGRYDRAREIKTEALRRHDAVLGVGHPLRAKLLNELGVIAGAELDLVAAAKYCDEALVLLEHVYDEPHQAIGETLSSRATLSLRRKDANGALVDSERALTNLLPTVGGDSPVVALVYNNRAWALSAAGRHADAVEALRMSVAIKERVLPPDHPDLALSYANLADLSARDADATTVESDFRKALAIREVRNEPEPLAMARARFALWLVDVGRGVEAQVLAEQALAEPTAKPLTRFNARYVLALVADGSVRREHARAALEIQGIEAPTKRARLLAFEGD